MSSPFHRELKMEEDAEVEEVARALLAAHDWTKNDGEQGGWDALTEDWKVTLRRITVATIETMGKSHNKPEKSTDTTS